MEKEEKELTLFAENSFDYMKSMESPESLRTKFSNAVS
jgi:hypothetical protein